jgi:hypothetical protein
MQMSLRLTNIVNKIRCSERSYDPAKFHGRGEFDFNFLWGQL